MQLITEGETQLWVINPPATKKTIHVPIGPGTNNKPVFFNPAMEFSRDLSILVIEQFIQEKLVSSQNSVRFLDGLAGTGARGVRLFNEIRNIGQIDASIVINDKNKFASEIIKKNIEINNISNAKPFNSDLNEILIRNRFDYIDIDPFGSPITFLDSGTRMIKNNGILAVTATDTATLFGTYPKTCLRRYDSYSHRTPFSHELGVRILIGSCVRFAAKHNHGLTPLLVHATDYYYRIYLKCSQGRSKADAALKNIGFFKFYGSGNEYQIIPRDNFLIQEDNNEFREKSKNKPAIHHAGPAWVGKIYDDNFVKKLDPEQYKFGTKKLLLKQLSIWLEESESVPGFYNINEISSELKISSPPISKVIQCLREHGFIATKTHFNPNAFKTNAGFSEICGLMKEIA